MPRKALDGEKLAVDIDRLEREDQISPPAAQPSLMDAVRGLATYIETRAKLGWTDPMIAIVLTKAGYPISADTLRSYRKRLRDEGLMPPLPGSDQKGKTRTEAFEPGPATTPIIKTTPAAPDGIDVTVSVAPAAASTATSAIRAANVAAGARAPPDPSLTPTQSPTRTFRVDRTKLPPDRA